MNFLAEEAFLFEKLHESFNEIKDINVKIKEIEKKQKVNINVNTNSYDPLKYLTKSSIIEEFYRKESIIQENKQEKQKKIFSVEDDDSSVASDSVIRYKYYQSLNSKML